MIRSDATLSAAMQAKEGRKMLLDVKEEGGCQWKVPSQSAREGDTKHDSSSTSSFFSGSNFTMSCSGTEEHEENERSTSGCSSFVPHSQRNIRKEKKKARVQEYLKELKALVSPSSKSGGQWKMGTLSTLEHVLSSMKKIKDAKAKHHDRKIVTATKEETPYTDTGIDMMHSVYESDSHESLASASLKSSDELRVILSGSFSVEAVSANLPYVVGYPKDCWINRFFMEYIHRQDVATFRGACKQERESETSDSTEDKMESKIFYIRMRKFKSLGSSGFSLRKQDQYVAFQCTANIKKMSAKELEMSKQQVMPSWYEDVSISASSGYSGTSDNAAEPSSPSKGGLSSESNEERGKDKRKSYTILYCVPLTTPYSKSGQPPEVNTFETRHNLFCNYCHIQPDTISLLGYLPQEMIGMSIFDFYHSDDLNTIYKVYQKVIALRGVPFKSGRIRILAKNGSYVTCSVEWSSFVNPWSNRLEFIVSKHTVMQGPENTDVFSENYRLQSPEPVPESVAQIRKKIKDLLVQPVQTDYSCNSPELKKHKGKTVAIIDQKDEQEPASPILEQQVGKVYCGEREHGKGLYLKEGSISRAYEQLNYTNCIKKFLLGQPRTFSSDSDVKKSSSEDGFDCDEAKETGKTLNKWVRRNLDDIVCTKHLQRKSPDSRSLPALDDAFWEKAIIAIDVDFDFDVPDFDINVPKPPSFGSSTKVLVSEQEHRDVENLLEPSSLREQIQPPTSQDELSMPPFSMPTRPPPTMREATVSTDSPSPPVMNLTRDLLLKHTVLQQQLYVATASPDRNVVFVNESQEADSSEVNTKRQNLKRIHSPDRQSSERFKTGRHTEAPRPFSSILNPSFPLIDIDKDDEDCDMSPCMSPNSSRVPAYPMTSLCKSMSATTVPMSRENASMQSSSVQQWPFYQVQGVSLPQQVMVGYQRSAQGQQPGGGTSSGAVPIPVYQMNSYVMQQASMAMPKAVRTPRKKAERTKSKAQVQQFSSESSSSTEDTSSSFYLLESSGNNMNMVYNELVLQSLGQQGPGAGVKLAPWLEGVPLSENMKLKYVLPRVKVTRQLKKDREALEAMVQPNMVLEQLEQHYEDLAVNSVLCFDEDQDVILQRDAADVPAECTCMRNMCCRNGNYQDHNILDAIRTWRKVEKKEKRGRKSTCQRPVQEDTSRGESKMDVDLDFSCGGSPGQNPEEKSKSESCKSSDSVEGENFIPCNMSSDSINSLNASDVTPSDQRSNNENGSSMKESDGDAMSKKSDSSSSDKQQTSESDSDSKVSFPDAKFDKLFGTLAICFTHLHKENAPWLIDVDFNEELQYRYTQDTRDRQTTLDMDKKRLQVFAEQDMVKEQFKALLEEISVEKDLLEAMPTIEEEERCDRPSAAATEGAGNEAFMLGLLASLEEDTLNTLFTNV